MPHRLSARDALQLILASDSDGDAYEDNYRTSDDLRHSTLGRTWVSGPAHTFSVFGPTVMYYI